jgi:hypothetical protein
MPPKFKIDIGPDGFIGNDGTPKFKVKENHCVEFNLVKGAAPVNVCFTSGSPFAESTIPVGNSGSGKLDFRPGTVGKTFSMKLQEPAMTDTSLKVMDGKTGDLEVDPYP